MSCCCATPSKALLGAACFVLVVFVPTGFYGLVEIVFHYSELEHQSLAIVSTVTCVGAVLLAIAGLIGRGIKSTQTLGSVLSLSLCWTAFAVAMTIWAAVVEIQSRTGAEGKILASGTPKVYDADAETFRKIVILCLGFVLWPLSWFTYELFAYRRQLREDPTTTSELEGQSFMSDNRRREKNDAMAKYSEMQGPPGTSQAELGRSRPHGRTRRGGSDRKGYAHAFSSSSGSESSDEEAHADGRSRSGSLRK
ncbi:hypothetical protein JCM16303_001817 [Sporobolomyces ruberrimus]